MRFMHRYVKVRKFISGYLWYRAQLGSNRFNVVDLKPLYQAEGPG